MTEWPLATLASICGLITDGSHFSPKTVSSGRPYVTVRNLGSSGIAFEDCEFVDEATFLELSKNGCSPLRGDVLFSKDGTVGKVAINDTDREFVVLSSLAILRPDASRVSSGYLALALSSHAFQSEATQQKTGLAIKRVVLKNLRTMTVPLPPLVEQRRIVDLVGALDAQIEAMRKEEQAVRQVLSTTRRDLLTPGTDWANRNLADVAEVRLGRMLSKERSTGSELHPYIRNANVQWAGVDLSDLKKMSFPEKEREKYALKAGDILVCEGGDPGRAVLLREDLPGIYYQKAIHRVRSTQVVPGFLYHWLAQSYVTDAISDLCTNTTIKHLTAEKFRTLSVFVPPTTGQQTLISNLLDDIVEMQVQLTAEVRALRDLRTVLLASLLSGHAEIPDSYDGLLPEAV